MSAPSQRRRDIHDQYKLWVNPCNFEDNNTPISADETLPDAAAADAEMLKAIVLQAGNALDSVEGFKHEYVRETFQQDFMNHHNSWKDIRYDWLFHAPKTLGEETQPDHLQSLKLNEFLQDAYRYLQIMAVALEQVAWDHQDSIFFNKFTDVRFKLRNVLCEIQTAMVQRNVTAHPDVDRDIMKDEFRYVKDNTTRNLRDWIIFRDYMIVLEYVREVFQYFLDNPSRITPS